MKIDKALMGSLISEANCEGSILVPTELLNQLTKSENPILQLSNPWNDGGAVFYNSLFNQFSFLEDDRIENSILPDHDRSQWVSLLRWFFNEIKIWKPEAGQYQIKLIALTIISSIHDWDDLFWDLMPHAAIKNDALVQFISDVVSKLKFTDQKKSKDFVNDDNTLERRFFELERDGNIVESLNLIQRSRIDCIVFPNCYLKQIIRIIYKSGSEDIVSATSEYVGILESLFVSSVLTNEQKFNLALKSHNHLIILSILFQCQNKNLKLFDGKAVNTQLSEKETQLLANLYVRISQNPKLWGDFLKLFISYGHIVPSFQPIIGLALVSMSEKSIIEYVNSLRLEYSAFNVGKVVTGNNFHNQDNLTNVFSSFANNADLQRRMKLWDIVYQKWNEWNYLGEYNQNQIITICSSNVDYALIGYSLECLTKVECDNKIEDILKQILNIEQKWYSSVVDLYADLYRLLSKYNIYARANQIRAVNENWINKNQITIPNHLTGSQYHGLRFETNIMI